MESFSSNAPRASLVRLDAKPIIVHLLVDSDVLDQSTVLFLQSVEIECD
jgi:hypothetical protein